MSELKITVVAAPRATAKLIETMRKLNCPYESSRVPCVVCGATLLVAPSSFKLINDGGQAVCFDTGTNCLQVAHLRFGGGPIIPTVPDGQPEELRQVEMALRRN